MPYPPVAHRFLNADGTVCREWLAYFTSFGSATSGGFAPASAEYLVGAPSGAIPNGRVPTITATVAWNFATAGQAKASVVPQGPDTAVQTKQGVALSGSANFTQDDAVTGKVRLTSVDAAAAGTDLFVLNAQGTAPGTGVVSMDVSADYQQIGFGIEDYLATNATPAYLFANAGAGGFGYEVLTDEVVGDPIAYSKGVGFDVSLSISAFEVYQYGGLGTGAVPGLSAFIGRNDSGSGAASTLWLERRDGTDQFLWVDATGLPRSGAGRPTEDNTTVSDTSGAVIGANLGANFQQFTEMTAPAAPATNSVRIYAEDNGGGKTRLMARFATGAAQQIAIEP